MRALVVSLFALLVAAPALGADGEPRKALTSQGQAIARSIVLKKSDLSTGFVAHKSSGGPHPTGADCAAVSESDLTVTGDASSPDFSVDALGLAVGSSASVYKTMRDSDTAWRRAGTPAAVQCFADLVRLSAPKGAALRIVSAKRIRFPQVGSKAIAYRVVATMKLARGQKVRAYFDAVVLQRGPVQAALVVTALASPVSLEQERGLAAVLVDRMEKAVGPSEPVA
jgi:hypothetical protein